MECVNREEAKVQFVKNKNKSGGARQAGSGHGKVAAKFLRLAQRKQRNRSKGGELSGHLKLDKDAATLDDKANVVLEGQGREGDRGVKGQCVGKKKKTTDAA